MKKLAFTLLFALFASISYAQGPLIGSAGASVGSGSFMGTIGVEKGFSLLSSKKLHINPGIRANIFSGGDLDYITAPAKLTADDANVDTVLMADPQMSFVNLFVRIEYDLSEKWGVGFNIDLVGLTLGANQTTGTIRGGTNYQNAALTTTVSDAEPTSVNALLVGDNDLGSLASSLYVSYDVSPKFGIDAGAGFVFTEYTTASPIGFDANDRFRNKNMMGYLGLHYTILD
jgi:hypothetical protein